MFCWKSLRKWSTSTSPFGPRMTLFLRSPSRASSNLFRPSSTRDTSCFDVAVGEALLREGGCADRAQRGDSEYCVFHGRTSLLVLATTQQHCQSPRPGIRPDMRDWAPGPKKSSGPGAPAHHRAWGNYGGSRGMGIRTWGLGLGTGPGIPRDSGGYGLGISDCVSPVLVRRRNAVSTRTSRMALH